jgi:hypothetical protein
MLRPSGDKPRVSGKRKWTNAQDKPFLKAHRVVIGQASALDLLPYFNKFDRTPFDPMHNMLLGLMRLLCKEVAQTGNYGDAENGAEKPHERGNRLGYALFTPTEERLLQKLIMEVCSSKNTRSSPKADSR